MELCSLRLSARCACVCTDCGRLVGYVTSMDLLVNARPSPLGSIVRPCEVVVRESDEYDDAIAAMRAKGLTYAPVVDDNYVVSGIITPADMMDEMEMEATDDVMRFSGSGGGARGGGMSHGSLHRHEILCWAV